MGFGRLNFFRFLILIFNLNFTGQNLLNFLSVNILSSNNINRVLVTNESDTYPYVVGFSIMSKNFSNDNLSTFLVGTSLKEREKYR